MAIFKFSLDPGAYAPDKAYITDAGFDLRAREDQLIKAHSYGIFHTGVHINIPQGYVGFLKSKSGLNVKYNITSDGVIDAGYTGEIIVKLYNHGDLDYQVKAKDKITQIVFLPIPNITLKLIDQDEFSDTVSLRGSNGFGSSGK